jgi:TIR domain
MQPGAYRRVRQFFTDLSENVSQLSALLPGQDVGFMDMAIDAGSAWSDDILWAAANCQVFVALVSPNYVKNSEWCAMEWDLFSQRRVFDRAYHRVSTTSAIIPVLWAPVESRLPREVADIQTFSPVAVKGDAEALYRDHGIFGILQMSRRSAYNAVVWTLAKTVVSTYNALWVEPVAITDTAGLRRRFGEAR